MTFISARLQILILHKCHKNKIFLKNQQNISPSHFFTRLQMEAREFFGA